MNKKYFAFSILIPVVLVSLLVITPVNARADWFEKKSFAATINSLFLKLKSFITNTQIPQETPPTTVQTNCLPPVPTKPVGIDSSSRYGSLTVTPEASTAGQNNIIKISANPSPNTLKGVSFSVPIHTDKSDLIDWHPNDPSAVKFNQLVDGFDKNSSVYGWGVVNDKTKLPVHQAYWVKLRARYPTIPERAKETTDAHGWKKITYYINETSTSRPGFQGIYVGREQKPSLITIIPNYDPKYRTLHGNFLKPFTVVPNGYFEIQTKSLGQPGTITLDVKNAKILGSAKREVKADEIVTWKIQPLGKDPVRLLGLSLTNACGEDHFVDPAKSARLADFDKFTFPVVYDVQVSVPVVVPKKSEPQPKLPTPTPQSKPSEQSKKVLPQNLIVSPSMALNNLKEGDKVTFTAKLVMSDGSTQTLKDQVKWTLIGQVGSITSAGVFSAKLDDAIAEYGEGSGIVTATYVDASGVTFLGKTPTFKVESFIPDDANMGG